MPDVFLSYARDDQPVARQFAAGLQREGFEVWWDQALNPGEAFDQVTERALEEAKAVIVLWSKTSVNSRWVRAEATQAQANQRLVPVMIEACKRPIMFELTHTADLSGWKANDDDPAWRAFVVSLRRLVGGKAAEPAALPAVATPAAMEQPRRPGLRAIAAALAVLLLCAGGWWALAHHGVTAPAAAALSAPEPTRILVRPFVDRSPGTDRSYVADNLASEITALLEQIRGLRPLGDATGRALKDRDPVEIGRTQSIRYLVDGIVSMEAGQIRITPQLIDTHDGGVLWSHPYQREFRDSFALYEEIAKDVAGKIGIVLDVGNMPRALGGTNNPEAYDKFLRAYHGSRPGPELPLEERRRLTQEYLQLLRDAVQDDPRFSTAWIALLTQLSNGALNASGNDAAAILKEREELTARLENLPFDGWQASRIHAEVYLYQNRWTEALAAARDAAQAAPSEDEGAKVLWPILLRVGRFGEAIPLMRVVLQADPLDTRAAGLLREALHLAGRDEEARTVATRFGTPPVPIVFLGQSDAFVQLMESGTGTNAGDLATLKKLLAGSDGMRVGELTDVSPRMLDDPKTVLATLHRAYGDPARRNEETLALISRLARFFGDRDLAFEAYRRIAVDFRRGSAGTWAYPDVRSDPRFKDVLRDLRLIDFWRQSNHWSDFCRPTAGDDFECH